MAGHRPATGEPLGRTILTFHTPRTEKLKGDHSYQRRILPTQKPQAALLSPQQQQHLLTQTHLYIRTFCTGLCGFTLILLLCLSPLPWVQFLLATNGLELHAGLWTGCEHKLCWSQLPRQTSYLQVSRTLFLLSAFTALVIPAWVISSCRHGKQPSAHLDRGVAILSLTSGVSLFFCLVFFLLQVKKHTSYTIESSFLWIFHFNWWGSFFYFIAGLVSFFNHRTFGVLPPDLEDIEFSLTRRLGINPKMWLTPTTEDMAESEMDVDSLDNIIEIEKSNKLPGEEG